MYWTIRTKITGCMWYQTKLIFNDWLVLRCPKNQVSNGKILLLKRWQKKWSLWSVYYIPQDFFLSIQHSEKQNNDMLCTYINIFLAIFLHIFHCVRSKILTKVVRQQNIIIRWLHTHTDSHMHIYINAYTHTNMHRQNMNTTWFFITHASKYSHAPNINIIAIMYVNKDKNV